MRNDGNLIVMGNGEKQLVPRYNSVKSQQDLLMGYICDVREGENTDISEIKS